MIALIIVCASINHCATGVLYCNENSYLLSVTAQRAVSAAARCLPADPEQAIEVARDYARRCGILSGEISYIDVSSDGSAISIKLSQRVPGYLLLMTVGLPETIWATATAKTHALTVASVGAAPARSLSRHERRFRATA